MPADKEFISFKCLQVIQPIGKFYIGVIDSRDLANIAFADVRRIEQEERAVDKYLGIERPLSRSRVEEIKSYVKTVDATFPTSIIVAVSSEDASFDSKTNTMKIRRDEKVAKVIDGQHRIAGLEGYDKGEFQLNLTIFIDMDMEDQAMVFATINLTQTRVSKSLMYDLYDFAKARSPQKTCHNIAKLLNSRDGSPFQNKIKILGLATGKPEESITQATFVERLMQYISRNPMLDRDLLKRGKDIERAKGKDLDILIFRNMFIDGRDGGIARNTWNFFKTVEKRWPEAWPVVKPGNILNRTNGFSALMSFLQDVYVHLDKPDIISIEECYKIFRKIKISDDDFTSEDYLPGTSGERKLYKDLLNQSGIGP
jgi:DGQHR domain-containing protein